MLNKLLKRCMPWQQRGKWIRIYYDALSASNVSDYSFRVPDGMTFIVGEEGWNFDMTFSSPVVIVATYTTITHARSGYTPETNHVNGDPSPIILLGTKGYIDYYINDIEVI